MEKYQGIIWRMKWLSCCQLRCLSLEKIHAEARPVVSSSLGKEKHQVPPGLSSDFKKIDLKNGLLLTVFKEK